MCSALLVVLLSTPAAQPGSSAPPPPDFEREIRPLLESACLACHSGAVVQADLRMDSREALLRGGVSGPAVVPGRSADSLLLKRIRGEGDLPRMPMGRTLEEAQVLALAAWIEAPVSGTRLKDEFFMKLVVLVSARLAEPRQLLERQRREYLQSLRDVNALLEANGKGPAAELLLEGAILHLKADLEWLELIEQRLALKEEV